MVGIGVLVWFIVGWLVSSMMMNVMYMKLVEFEFDWLFWWLDSI